MSFEFNARCAVFCSCPARVFWVNARYTSTSKPNGRLPAISRVGLIVSVFLEIIPFFFLPLSKREIRFVSTRSIERTFVRSFVRSMSRVTSFSFSFRLCPRASNRDGRNDWSKFLVRFGFTIATTKKRDRAVPLVGTTESEQVACSRLLFARRSLSRLSALRVDVIVNRFVFTVLTESRRC